MKSSMPPNSPISARRFLPLLLRAGELRGVRHAAQAPTGATAHCCARTATAHRALAAHAATAAPAVARFPTAVAEIAGASVDVAVIGKSRIAVAPIGVVGVPRAQAGTSGRVAPRLRMDRRVDIL